jgi:3-oxoacyl-[acyl-carrier protein] reductase
VNLRGVFLVCRAAAPLLAARGGGHILNLSSHSGRVGARGQANYAAAKAGVIGLTQSLARELGPQNIRVNAVLPGVLPTPMTAGLTPEQLAAFARANALNRLNDPAEVARFLVFLTTLANVSGQVFQLDSRVTPWT